jgi:hypothetical protein
MSSVVSYNRLIMGLLLWSYKANLLILNRTLSIYSAIVTSRFQVILTTYCHILGLFVHVL